MPLKCKDPGAFTIPCKLGNINVPRVMLDNGASINVLPYSIFKTLNVGDLKRTGVAIQLADKSIVHPKGVLEDVLVQVKHLVFPADFYVLDMGDDDNPNSSSILLGRPFLKTARTKIDCYNGSITMEFDGNIIDFHISEKQTQPIIVQSVNFLNTIEPNVDNCDVTTNKDLQVLVDRNLNIGTMESRVIEEEEKEGWSLATLEKELSQVFAGRNGSKKKAKEAVSEASTEMVKVKEEMVAGKEVDVKVVSDMVKKKKKKRRKWKWLKVDFPCVT